MGRRVSGTQEPLNTVVTDPSPFQPTNVALSHSLHSANWLRGSEAVNCHVQVLMGGLLAITAHPSRAYKDGADIYRSGLETSGKKALGSSSVSNYQPLCAMAPLNSSL